MKSIFLTVALMVSTGLVLGADQWPQFLGPHRNGSVDAPGLFKEKIELEQVWKVPLGSGFSSVVIGNGKLFAMHADGEMDAISCFEAATGKKQWSHKYGPAFPKNSGSEPGPLSTPILDGKNVYGMGANGELFCLNAADGKVVWSQDLVKDSGAIVPTFGMTSSPLIYKNFLILNVGNGKDKALAAFNKKTGKLAWHVGDGNINYHSPTLTTLLGREQIITQSETKMQGIDPATGNVIWEKTGSYGVQAVPVGDNRFLLDSEPNFILHQITEKSGKMEISEVWNNPNMTIQYNIPVIYKGHIYGHKGKTMTCLNLETGEKAWAERNAGGRGMSILVDGHLAVISKDGVFRIVRATEKAYEERASLKIMENGGWTQPTYADGVFYLRDYTHLIAVKVK